MQINIAIDGHSACGKSTLARALAAALGFRYIDSGAMYRAVSYHLLSESLPINDETFTKHLSDINIEIKVDQQATSVLFLNGQSLGPELRTTAVNEIVSQVSALSAVRRHLVSLQQKMGVDKGVVMDGRDIGSVVFPDADLKIFLTANHRTRVQRRLKEIVAINPNVTEDEVSQNLKHRDHTDSTRSHSPLTQTKDAIVIDNSNLSREEQLAMVLALARLRMRDAI